MKATGSVDKKMKYLRRIPKDPMTNSFEWGLRSTATIRTSQILGRPERIRCVHQEHGQGARWDSIFRMVSKLDEVAVPQRRPERRRFGFTFIELMIVMAIIAVLMSVAMPIYTRSIIRVQGKRAQEQPVHACAP